MVAEDSRERIERRVREAAEAALEDRQFVTAIDVLVGMGWVARQRSSGGGRDGSRTWSG